MATRSKTPSAPAKRGKNTIKPDAPAPAKTKVQRKTSAAAQPEAQSAPAPDASTASGAKEQTFEAPAARTERQPAAAGASREDRAGRALDAIKTLGEMIADGIGTLAELRAEVQRMNGRLDQLAANRSNAGRAGPDGTAGAADDYQAGRDHDPGDAVPPGVAVMSPAPLTETDEAALHSLEELPKRAGRGKRGPRAKA